jgi:8-oxo-dGTP pyrophosphatase MutT (NUDIX family)
VRATAEELPFTADLALARALLASWAPPDREQKSTRDAMLAFIDAHPLDAHLRSRPEGHLTASALVLDAHGGRALLTFHKKLGRWLQLGGHCDGDANLPGAALREAREESGIDDLSIDPTPVDVDIHRIPARANEPEHLHLDTRFLVWAPPGARETASDESLELGWFTRAESERLATDDSVRRLFRIAFAQA